MSVLRVRRWRARRTAVSPGDLPEERGLVANSSALLGARLVRAVLGWGGTVLIARSLSLEDFGAFTLIFTVLALMSVVTDMGIGRIAIRGMLGDAGHDPGAFAGTYLVLRTVLGMVGYAVALLVVLLLGYPARVFEATIVGGVVVLLATPSRALDVVFQSRMRLGVVGASESGAIMAQFALTAAVAAAGSASLILFTLPAVLAEVVGLAWKFPAAHRLVRLRLRVDLRTWRALLTEALPLSIGFGLATIYARIDALMLAKMVGLDAVAVYGISYKFIDIMHFASTAVTVPLMTLLVKAWPHDPPAFREAMRRGAMLLGLLAGAALTGLIGFAGPATSLLYGDVYAVGANVTRVLAAAEALHFVVALGLVCLVSIERNRHYPVVMALGLALNVAINLWAIPRYSYHGAAVTTLITEAVVLVALWGGIVRVPHLRPFGMGRLVVVPIALLGALVVGWGLDLIVPWVPAAVAALATYCGLGYAGGLAAAAGIGATPQLRRRSS